MTARADYREIRCKSALNRVTGMPFTWSLNPYRGCVHGCHYCFARRYHEYFELNAGDDFTSIVFVKTNVTQVLREELWMPRWQRETVAIGTATDPYQPIEGRYRLTRGCVEALSDRRNPVNIVTKGPLIVRDADVLGDLARGPGCVVCFSVTTLDRELAARLEPTTAPPMQRLRALRALADAGVDVGVLIAPVVPGITDSPSRIDQVAQAAAAHGASFIGGRVLELKPGTKEHFRGFIEAEYPELTGRYTMDYPGAYPPKQVTTQVQHWIAESAAAYGLAARERTTTRETATQLEMELA